MIRTLFLALTLGLSLAPFGFAQEAQLQGFGEYVNKAMKDWDAPGVGIAIVPLPFTIGLITLVAREFLVPARAGCGVLFVIAQDGEHSLRVEMGAGRNDGVDGRQRRDV